MDKRSTVRHWDDIYASTQQYQRLYLYNQQLMDVIVRSLHDELPGKKILEVGCGKAKESLELARRGAEVTGVDYSTNAISLLEKVIAQTSSTMTAIQCDGGSLPFEDGTFDLVFSQGVIEHFEDPLPLLREQYRVLRPGGVIVVEVPNKYNVYTIYKHVLMAIGKWPPGWETQYSPTCLSRVIRAANFVPDRIVGWDTFSLRAIRKVSKMIGVREHAEHPWQQRWRRRMEVKPIVIWLSLSLTITAQKPIARR